MFLYKEEEFRFDFRSMWKFFFLGFLNLNAWVISFYVYTGFFKVGGICKSYILVFFKIFTLVKVIFRNRCNLSILFWNIFD